MSRKGDYDGAIEQYIRTIGQLEPSYVIRKVIYENAKNIATQTFLSPRQFCRMKKQREKRKPNINKLVLGCTTDI